MGKSPSLRQSPLILPYPSATNIKEKERDGRRSEIFRGDLAERGAEQSGFLKDKTDVTDAMLTTREG